MGVLDPETLFSRKWGFGPLSGVGGIPSQMSMCLFWPLFLQRRIKKGFETSPNLWAYPSSYKASMTFFQFREGDLLRDPSAAEVSCLLHSMHLSHKEGEFSRGRRLGMHARNYVPYLDDAQDISVVDLTIRAPPFPPSRQLALCLMSSVCKQKDV